MRAEHLRARPGRLDAVVASMLGVSRADVQRAIEHGLVLVDGEPQPKSFRLSGGERVDARLPQEEAIPAEGPPVPVRFEDGSLAVVAKPAGVVTHPTTTRRTGTLVNRLLGMGMHLAPAGGPLRPGIVHRLDVGTSGLLIVAKTDEAYSALQGDLRRHSIGREYLALVRGAPEGERFTVDAPLGRRAARVVVDRVDGRTATTSFAVRERLGKVTLLEAAPETGRTHQIRVHLSAVGLPILGDRAYGGVGEDSRALGLPRPFLHAWRLRLDHPVTHEELVLEEELPADLAEALHRARVDLRP